MGMSKRKIVQHRNSMFNWMVATPSAPPNQQSVTGKGREMRAYTIEARLCDVRTIVLHQGVLHGRGKLVEDLRVTTMHQGVHQDTGHRLHGSHALGWLTRGNRRGVKLCLHDPKVGYHLPGAPRRTRSAKSPTTLRYINIPTGDRTRAIHHDTCGRGRGRSVVLLVGVLTVILTVANAVIVAADAGPVRMFLAVGVYSAQEDAGDSEVRLSLKQGVFVVEINRLLLDVVEINRLLLEVVLELLTIGRPM